MSNPSTLFPPFSRFRRFRGFRVFAWPAPASPGAETHVSYAQGVVVPRGRVSRGWMSPGQGSLGPVARGRVPRGWMSPGQGSVPRRVDVPGAGFMRGRCFFGAGFPRSGGLRGSVDVPGAWFPRSGGPRGSVPRRWMSPEQGSPDGECSHEQIQ